MINCTSSLSNRLLRFVYLLRVQDRVHCRRYIIVQHSVCIFYTCCSRDIHCTKINYCNKTICHIFCISRLSILIRSLHMHRSYSLYMKLRYKDKNSMFAVACVRINFQNMVVLFMLWTKRTATIVP